MLYFTLVFVIFLLGLFALYEWLLHRHPSKQKTEFLQKNAQQLIAEGHFEAAQKELKPLLRTHSGGATTLLLHAQVLRKNRQLESACDVISAALHTYPDNLLLEQEKGRILLEQGKTAEALESLQRAEPVMRGEEDTLDLATAFVKMGRSAAAWSYLKDHALESCNGRLLALAGDCQFDRGDYPLAIRFYQQAQHFGWINQRTLSRTGYSLHCTGDLSAAERYFREILERDSSDVTATLGLGTCFEAKQLYQRALLVYQSGQAWDSAHPLILRQAGICAVHTKQFCYAEKYLRGAFEKEVYSPQALAYLGYSLEKQRRWEEAEEVYLDLIERYSDHAAGYRGLAWLYGVGLSTTLDRKQGLAAAHQALQLLTNATSWEILSACEARAGNFTRAHYIQENLSIQANDPSTRMRRRQAMRTLRMKIPLNEQHVYRTLVA